MKTIILNFNVFALIIILAAFSFELKAQKEEDFYSINHISEIRLTITTKNYSTTLDSMKLYGEGMIEADATIDGTKIKGVGIRYRGGSSYGVGKQRNPWNIKLDFTDQAVTYQGIKTIKLSNALRDPSMVREVLGYEIASKYMAAPRCNYSKLYVNNEYQGLFVNVESIDDQFIMRNFGSDDGAFFKCSPDPEYKSAQGCRNMNFSSFVYEQDLSCYEANYTALNKGGYEELQILTKELAERPISISTKLNIDQVLWMHAFNNVLANLSSYSGNNSQNFYLYRHDDGRFVPIIWDLNLCFGSFKNTGIQAGDLSNKEMEQLTPLLHKDNKSKPLISQLLANKEWELIYLAHCRQIIEDYFIGNKLEKRVEELHKIIRKDFIADPYKEYTIMDFDKSAKQTIGTRSKIPGLVDFMKSRVRFLRKTDQLKSLPSEIVEMSIAKRKPLDNKKVKTFLITAKTNGFAKKIKLMYSPEGEAAYFSSFMYDDGTHGDEISGDDIFSYEIDPIGRYDKLTYYFMTETALTVGFYPSDYYRNPLQTSITELNK